MLCYDLNSFGLTFPGHPHSWLWKSFNMADRGSEFSFSGGISIRNYIRIDISISIRPLNTKFDKQVDLKELTYMRLIKQELVTSSHQDHFTLKRFSKFLSAKSVIIKCWQNDYEEKIVKLRLKSYGLFITWSCDIKWQT